MRRPRPLPAALTGPGVARRVAREQSICLALLTLVLLLGSAILAPAAETLFEDGPQEFGGRKYYWLAEWRLAVVLPADVGPDDQFEVLFGTKGPARRALSWDYDGRSGVLLEVGPEPFVWMPLPLGALSAGKRVTLAGPGDGPVAFLAGVRITGRSAQPLEVHATRVAGASTSSRPPLKWAALPGFAMSDETRRLWDPAPAGPDWQRAERSAQYAGIALTKVQRWLHDCCLPVRDGRSGLFRPTGAVWNYQDTAADCYPFYVWAAYFTDLQVLNTVLLETLDAEQRLCNRVGRIPVNYDMDAGRQVEMDYDAMVFGASEYAKDGLVPIVELTGRSSPWCQRMQGLVDDIFASAPYETPYGNIPSTNVEVNGDLLQILPRLHAMTNEPRYLDWAHRLADYYLLPGGFVPTRLSDHGCEIIGGLGLLFAVDQTACPEKARQYQPHLEHMFDEILRRGVNSDGIIVGDLQSTVGPHDSVVTRDGWGYDFVGFLDYDLALGSTRYRDAIRRPLAHLLKPRYLEFDWDHRSRDNVADSVEGGLYLLRHLPTPEGFVWADREIATLLVDHTDPSRLWEVHKLEANTVRTVLIHTMLHTRNTVARPWQPGLQLGGAPCGDGLCLFLKSDTAYAGQLHFDVPRHRLTFGFQQAWPRMNAVPEWFTVEPDDAHQYTVENLNTGATQVMSGKSLADGLPVRLEPGEALRIVVRPA